MVALSTPRPLCIPRRLGVVCSALVHRLFAYGGYWWAVADHDKTPANSGALRNDTDVPPKPNEDGPGSVPRDGADPRLTDDERRARLGSAGGGAYGPGAPHSDSD